MVENVIVQGLFCVWLIQILDGGWNEGFKAGVEIVVVRGLPETWSDYQK